MPTARIHGHGWSSPAWRDPKSEKIKKFEWIFVRIKDCHVAPNLTRDCVRLVTCVALSNREIRELCVDYVVACENHVCCVVVLSTNDQKKHFSFGKY